MRSCTRTRALRRRLPVRTCRFRPSTTWWLRQAAIRSPYATFGTPELARVAAEALAVKNACLLSHHGVLAAGKSLQAALTLAVEVENLAHQYVVVCQLGKPKLISYEEMNEVLRSFRTYGQQSVEGESK